MDLKLRAVLLLGCLALSVAKSAIATPPNYLSFKREQRIEFTPNAQRLLRIWAINIGQGDAFLIQLPPAFDAGQERVDILVDGGPNGQQLPLFLKQLYGNGDCTIEYAVLTHHDNDHVAGLTTVLSRPEFTVHRIFHNGLVSWRPEAHDFQTLIPSDWDRAVFSVKRKSSQPPFIDRGMAFLEPDGRRLRTADLILDLDMLRTALNGDELEGIYERFAQAITAKTGTQTVEQFSRTDDTTTFPTFQTTANTPAVTLLPLWPKPSARRYASSTRMWAYTINGNSVTFKLTYGDFEMLFTGDHNDESEQDLLDALPDTTVLHADVLKVPHHGSAHSLKRFFQTVDPVLSVASMGRNNYGHPSAEAVSWAGGAHRIYHTHRHERKFPSGTLTAAAKAALVEDTHVLIETDGVWFRIVETDDPRAIPNVHDVVRGNGTRWIRATD